MAAFIYDDFDDNILGAHWDYDVGNGSAVEQNQRLEQTVALENEHEFGQTFTVDEIDVWVKVTAPANYLNIVQLRVSDVITGDFAYVEIEGQGAGAWLLNRGWGDGVNTNGVGDSVDIGSNNSVWLRLRYVPSEGDTFIRTFYALTDPLVGGWIEGTRINGAVVPVLANGNSRLEFRLFSDTATQQTVFWDFADEWLDLTTTSTTTTTTTAPSFVPDEFNDIDGFLSDREYWGYNVFKTLNGPPWTITKADRDEFNFIQDNKLVHLWKQESGYYYGQEVDQGRIYDPDANPPLGDWIYYGLTGALDIYTKVTLPSTTGMTEVSPGGGNFQFIYNDENGYGPGLWVYHADDVASTWQWVLASWVYNYNDDYDEGTYIGLGTDALDIWVRMTWPLDASTCKIYYALSEPDEDSDWIDITPTTYTFTPNGTDLPFLQMFSQGNSFNLPEDLYVYYDYFRRWPTFREDEFNDEAVADFWNIAGTGTVSESDGQLILDTDSGENAEVNQENLQDPSFDIWAKIKLITNKAAYDGMSLDLYDAANVYGYIALTWDINGAYSGKEQFILEAYYTPVGGSPSFEKIIGLGLNVNEVYLRMKWDDRPSLFYAFNEPQSDEDWIEFDFGEVLPTSTPTDYWIDLYNWSNTGGSSLAIVDFIRNWSPEPILAGSQGARGSMIPGLINEGFGGFGFGWG